MPPSPILQPVAALVLWSFVMFFWLYATRIPALRGQTLDPTATLADLNARIPPQVRWKADNYNHLMEQPTLFYAVALSLALTGSVDTLDIALAWGYVGLRVVHSLVQATVNVILARWAIFMVGSMLLLALAVRLAITVFA